MQLTSRQSWQRKTLFVACIWTQMHTIGMRYDCNDTTHIVVVAEHKHRWKKTTTISLLASSNLGMDGSTPSSPPRPRNNRRLEMVRRYHHWIRARTLQMARQTNL